MEKSLKINSANSRGLDNQKIATVRKGFENGDVDIFFLSETQHKCLQKFSRRFGDEYIIAGNPTEKWGTAVILREKCKHRVKITNLNTTSYQSQTVEVSGFDNIKIVSMYIPPSLVLTSENMNKIIDQDPDVILGDFNCRHPSWSKKIKSRQTKEQENRVRLFQGAMSKLGLISVFDPSVETLKNIKGKFIGSVDAILIKPKFVYRSQARDFFSDHRELSVTFKVSDCCGFKENRKENDFFIDLNKLSPNELKTWWVDKIGNNNKPKEETTCSDFVEWFGLLTNHLRTKKYPKKPKPHPDLEILESTEGENEFFEALIKNTPPEKVWGVFNRIKNAKNKELNKNEVNCVKTKFVTNRRGQAVPFEKIKYELTEHFKKDIKQTRKSLLNRKDESWVNEQLNNFSPDPNFIKKYDVIRALKNIKDNVSTGLDFVSPDMIPTKSAVVIDALFHAVRNAFRTSNFPNTLKTAKLAFFVKPSKNSKTELSVSDFRGVCIGKYLMKIIDLVQLYKYTEHLESSGLRANHHGFRTLRGVTDNFGTILPKIRKNMEKKLVTALLLLDLSSAYNRLDHAKLIFKLLKAGCDPQLVKFTQYWLSDRSMIFEHFIILAGVSALPQGSSVSPILFIYYCDFTMPEGCGESFFICYADDSSIQIVAKSWKEADDRIVLVMNAFHKWARLNGLTVSVLKTEILCINRKHKGTNKVVRKYTKQEVRYLGLWLDSNMTFDYHINVILEKKLTCLIYALKFMGSFCRLQTRRAFLFSIFQVFIWPLFYILGVSETQKNVLKSWYLKLTRAAARMPKFVDWTSLETVIGLENFDVLLTRQVAVKVFSIDARNYWYTQNGVINTDTTCEIYTPFRIEKDKPGDYNLRNTRNQYPFTHTKKVVQNCVYESVNTVLPMNDAPWRKSENYFKNVAFEKIKCMARCYLEPLFEKREKIIKNSLYFHDLKKLESREQEMSIMSEYLESRRTFWNFCPEELKNTRFCLK